MTLLTVIVCLVGAPILATQAGVPWELAVAITMWAWIVMPWAPK